MLRAVSSWVWNNSCGWRHKCSGKPVPVFSHPYSKIDFLMSKWNFLCFTLGPLSLFLSLGWEEASPAWTIPTPPASPRGADTLNETVQLQQLFPQIPNILHYMIWSDLTIHRDEHIYTYLPLNIRIWTTIALLSAKWLFSKEGLGNIIKWSKGKHCIATPWKWHCGFPPLSGNYQLEGSVEKQSDAFHSLQMHPVIIFIHVNTGNEYSAWSKYYINDT